MPGAEDQQVASLVAKYRERYADTGYAENSIYEGVPEALDALRARNLLLGVCTSKRGDFAERILEMFGIRNRFLFVSGGDIGIRKLQQLRALLSDALVNKSSLMIGDRAVDISAAQANGMSAVGVLWGYGSEHELREAGAMTLLKHVSELSMLSRAA